MEFRDLKYQYQVLKDDISKNIEDVCVSGEYIMGKYVKELEQKLAEYVGVKHCITCANGTDALKMVLMGWNVKKGDAVFVPTFTFFASAEVVADLGATPIFIDVDERTFNIDVDDLKSKIEKVKIEGQLNLKAIIAVDLFGLPADYTELEKIAKENDLLLLEDGAQGFGGNINGRQSCSFGDAATTSFFPAKPLGCYGDGGAIFTNDDELANYLISIRVHGKGKEKYDNVRLGLNSRLDNMQAAILLPKFKAFKDYELNDINKVYEEYTKRLKDIAITPLIPEGFYSSFAQYTIILENQEIRDGLQKHLKEKGIPSMVYYPKPLHQQTAFSYLEHKEGDYPVSEKLSKTVLSLPMHPYLKLEDIEEICNQIKFYLKDK